MSQVTAPILLDSTGQDISAKLQAIANAINGGTIDPLTVTQNGTYTPSGTTLGYGPVTVDVQSGGGVPLLTRAQWNALSTAQKKAYGLLAIQDANSGFDRGKLVYGADYSPFVKLLEVCQNAYNSVPTTYIADTAMRVLAINCNVHTNTDSTACTATITTTGTVIATDTQTSTTASGGSSTAGQMTFSVIDLAVGDTIILSNNSVVNTKQIHLIIESDITTLTNIYWDIWPDKKSGNQFTKTLGATKKYLVFALQISNNTRSQSISADINPVTASITYDGSSTNYYAYMTALVYAAGNVIISTSDVENFIGNAYAVYEVTT